MKEEVSGIRNPAIAEVVGTFLDERGERFYKLRWDETWESENSLQEYSMLIDKFWTKNPFLIKDKQECELNMKRIPSAEQSPELRDEPLQCGNDIESPATLSKKSQCLTMPKRNAFSTLESIVSKLKQSIRPEVEGSVEPDETSVYDDTASDSLSSSPVYSTSDILSEKRSLISTQRTWVPPVERGYFAGRSHSVDRSKCHISHNTSPYWRTLSRDRNHNTCSESSFLSCDPKEVSSSFSSQDERDYDLRYSSSGSYGGSYPHYSCKIPDGTDTLSAGYNKYNKYHSHLKSTNGISNESYRPRLCDGRRDYGNSRFPCERVKSSIQSVSDKHRQIPLSPSSSPPSRSPESCAGNFEGQSSRSVVHYYPPKKSSPESIPKKRRKRSPFSEIKKDPEFMSNLFTPMPDVKSETESPPVPSSTDTNFDGVVSAASIDDDDKQSSSWDPSKDKIEPTACKKCNKVFYRMSQLQRHISNHVVHECEHCNALFYSLKNLKAHIKRNHECYPCDFCNELLYDASSWYQHRAKHTMLECPSCEMIFYNKTAVMKHRLEHVIYICSLCGEEYDQYTKWVSHRHYHSNAPRHMTHPLYVCKVCREAAKSQEAFYRHKCSYVRKKSIGDQLAIQNRLTEPAPVDIFDS